MDIYEKLARCSTPGEVKRMLAGTRHELISLDEKIPGVTLRDIYECVEHLKPWPVVELDQAYDRNGNPVRI